MLKVRRGNSLAGIYEKVFPIIIIVRRSYSFPCILTTIRLCNISSPIAQLCSTGNSKLYFVGSSLRRVDFFCPRWSRTGIIIHCLNDEYIYDLSVDREDTLTS